MKCTPSHPSLDGITTGFSSTKPKKEESKSDSQDKVTQNRPAASTPSPRGHA